MKLATGTEQIEALVDLIAGEGFTSQIDLVDDTAVRDDMRFRFAGPLVDHVSGVNEALVAVLPDKVVVSRTRSQVSSEVELTWDILESIKVERSRESFKTSLTVRGGALTRLELHTGRVDGRYRLGGEQNLHPAISFFDVTAVGEGVGEGVLQSDERDISDLGSTLNAIVIAEADSVDWPSALVSGSDTSVLSLELNSAEGLVLEGVTLPSDSTLGVALRASDLTEYGWSLAGLTPRPEVLYGVSASSLFNASGLWRINPADPSDESGDFGLIGALPAGLTHPSGLTQHNGSLYCVNNAPGAGTNSLWRINRLNPVDDSGSYGLVGDLTAELGSPAGITSHNGSLYCVEPNLSDRGTLWIINEMDPGDESGDFGEVGRLPFGLRAVGLASQGGVLYAVENYGLRQLWIINTVDPSAGNVIGNLPSGVGTLDYVNGLASFGGVLYCGVSDTTEIYILTRQIQTMRLAFSDWLAISRSVRSVWRRLAAAPLSQHQRLGLRIARR